MGRIAYLAVLRHYEDMRDGAERGLVFSHRHAWHVITFIERWFVHGKGPLAGKPLLLDPWQKFWTAVKYGWRWQDTGLRRFTRAYEEVARKNGKSTWKGPEGAYLWLMDSEVGAEVYAVATTRAQAMTVFKPAFDNVKRWCRKSAGMARSVKVFEGLHQEKLELLSDGTSSVFQPLPANADNLDGLNPSAILFDELHAQKTREVWDVMESALGARAQPMLSAITTAGFILDGICTEVRRYLVAVLENERQDDAVFGYVYTLDEGDDPFDERVWIKANPGLGMSKQLNYMRAQAKKAAALPSAQANFKTKDLNLWVNDASGWLDITVWDKCGREKWKAGYADVLPALKGRRCFGGLDLASTRDLTALALVFPPDDESDPDAQWVVLVWHFCPAAKVSAEAELDDVAKYREWADAGWLTATDGNVTDYGPVKERILWARAEFDLVELGFDKWNALQIANELMELDVPLVEVPQNTGGMYPGSQKLEKLIYGGQLRHGANPVLRYCAQNVALLWDTNDNFRPDKKKSKLNGRIDGIVATVMALSRAVGGKAESDTIEQGYVNL